MAWDFEYWLAGYVENRFLKQHDRTRVGPVVEYSGCKMFILAMFLIMQLSFFLKEKKSNRFDVVLVVIAFGSIWFYSNLKSEQTAHTLWLYVPYVM